MILISSSAANKFLLGYKSTSILEILGEREVLRLRGKFSSLEEELFITNLRELIKFLFLSAYSQKSLFFPGNRLMDDLWHAMITETASYRRLCNALRPNSFIDHSGTNFEDYLELLDLKEIHAEQMSWLASYRSNFGPIDEQSWDCLLLAQSISNRLNTNRAGLNNLSEILVTIGSSNAEAPVLSLENFLDQEVLPNSQSIDRDPGILRQHLQQLVKTLRSARSSEYVTNEELEGIFSRSTALAFTFWQHLAVVERLSNIEEWQANNSELWKELKNFTRLCGLATTHLAKAGGAAIYATKTEGGYLIKGKAPWVCGHGIFEKLLIGFETSESVVFVLADYPSVASSESANFEIREKALACLNGSSAVEIEFSDYFVSKDSIVSEREKSVKPAPRPTKYKIPEIGIGVAAMREIDSIISESENPKHVLIRNQLHAMVSRLKKIKELQSLDSSLEDLYVLRDEFNRDATRLLAIALGGEALSRANHVTRLMLEALLMDCVAQSPDTLNRKILLASNG